MNFKICSLRPTQKLPRDKESVCSFILSSLYCIAFWFVLGVNPYSRVFRGA